MPELIEIAGGTNIISSPGKHSPKIELKRILEEQPAKIVIAPCGFRVYQTMNDINLLALKPEWRKLNAVKNNEVYVVDGNSYFNRPSHRIVDSLEVLASVIHPGLFNEKRDLALRLGEL